MRIYYIFEINKLFASIYRNKPYKIYKLLEEIYNTKHYDIFLTYRTFNEFAERINKQALNEYIYYNYKNNSSYQNISNIHYLNNNIKLIINNSNIKIKSSVSYVPFFRELNKYSQRFFVCDFASKDYFWLSALDNDIKVSKKDRQNNYDLLK